MVKLDGKVFDEYFEKYVDAHERERVEEPTDTVCRIAEFCPVNSARGGMYACALHCQWVYVG